MSKGVDYLSTLLLDTSSLLVSLSPSLARAKAKKDNGGTWQRLRQYFESRGAESFLKMSGRILE